MSPENITRPQHFDVIEHSEDTLFHYESATTLDDEYETLGVSEDSVEPSDISNSEQNRIDFEGMNDIVEKLKLLDSLDGKWLKLRDINDVKDINLLTHLIGGPTEADTYELLLLKSDLLNLCRGVISREVRRYREENHLQESESKINNTNNRDYLMNGPQITEFVGQAACKGKDIDLFFPVTGVTPRTTIAICSNCEVKPQCLEFAVNNEHIHGIWGGTNDADRRRIRKTKIVT